MPQIVRWQSYSISRWRRHVVPGAVWLVAAGTIGWLFTERSVRFSAPGIAQGEQRQIAAQKPGRLLLLPVDLFEEVRQGQTLAVLEDERIQAQLATAAAETARLRAELVATEDRLTAETQTLAVNRLSDARRFALDVEQSRVNELELTVTNETDRITLQRLRFRLDRLLVLRDTGSFAADELETAQTKYASLEKQIEENENVLSQLRCDSEEARQRRDAFVQLHFLAPASEIALEPLRAALTVQERRIAELALARAMLVLQSPIEGTVSELVRRPGETVAPGQPILVVSAPRPSEIIAYATAGQVSRINVGAPVDLTLVRLGNRQTTRRSRVVGVGPAVEQLPARLWQNPSTPEWGWPIRISTPVGLPLISGETLVVRGL